MKNSDGLKFRFVKGRVIPISGTKENKSNAVKGLAVAAVGVGLAVGAGAIYRKQVTQSISFAARGFSGLERAAGMTARNAAKVESKAFEFLKAGAKIGKLTPGMRIGGIAVGSVLIGAGLAKAEKARNPNGKLFGVTSAKAVAGTAATTAFLTGAYGLAGTKHGLKGFK